MATKKKNPVTEMKISDAKRKAAQDKLDKAVNLAGVKAAVEGLEPAERNALACQISEAIDRIVLAQ